MSHFEMWSRVGSGQDRCLSAILKKLKVGFFMIQMTQTAAQKIHHLRQDENRSADFFLRVYVKKGGCSGLSYKMEFDNVLKEGDQSFEHFNEKLVVDRESFMYLVGMTLDYSGGLNGRGFVFENPNASKSCGCGSSFNV